MRKLLDAEGFLAKATDQRDTYKELLALYQAERDEYKVLQESLQDLLQNSLQLQEKYRVQREDTEAELVIVEGKYLEQARVIAELEANSSWSDWEVGLFSGLVGMVAITVGVGVTALVYEVRQ